MALIPNDVGIRLRLQGDGQLLQPLQPVLEIPSDLPELRPGQTFTARIQEALPENTYKALVAGKSLTLSLPEGAQAGDTLELVVIDRSPRAVFAQRVSTEASLQAATAQPEATLSRAAQLIGSLLPPEGEAAAPVPLNRGQPLLPAAPADARALAPALAQAVRHSGLFYEAHQAQWVAGRLPLTQLLAEPQAQHAPLPAHTGMPASAEAPMTDAAQKSVLAIRQPLPAASPMPGALPPLGPALGDSQAEATRIAANTAEARIAPGATGIPEELRPIVQQQLDAVATQRMAWHGEVWPDQRMNWEIEWDGPRDGRDQADAGEWSTTLRLVTPRLGELQARLQWAPAGIRIAIDTPYGASAADLQDATPLLENSLAAAGIPLLSLHVRHERSDT